MLTRYTRVELLAKVYALCLFSVELIFSLLS